MFVNRKTLSICQFLPFLPMDSLPTKFPESYFTDNRKLSLTYIWRGKKCSVQFSRSVVSSSLRPHELQHTNPSLSVTNSWSLLKLMSIKSLMPSNHLMLCSPLLLLPSIFPSIRVFSNELAVCIRWPKYWSFSFSIIPSNEYSELMSLRIDWFGLLAVQGTLKSLYCT